MSHNLVMAHKNYMFYALVFSIKKTALKKLKNDFSYIAIIYLNYHNTLFPQMLDQTLRMIFSYLLRRRAGRTSYGNFGQKYCRIPGHIS